MHHIKIGEMVRGTTCIKFWSNGKGGPQASNFSEMVSGEHMYQILVKW